VLVYARRHLMRFVQRSARWAPGGELIEQSLAAMPGLVEQVRQLIFAGGGRPGVHRRISDHAHAYRTQIAAGTLVLRPTPFVTSRGVHVALKSQPSVI
jgi:hypothetical protein